MSPRKQMMGRRVQPMVAVVAVMMLVQAVRIVSNNSAAPGLNTSPGDLVAILAAMSGAAIIGGWVARVPKIQCAGLLWAATVWLTVGLVYINGDNWWSGMQTLLLGGMIAWAWLVEVDYIEEPSE